MKTLKEKRIELLKSVMDYLAKATSASYVSFAEDYGDYVKELFAEKDASLTDKKEIINYLPLLCNGAAEFGKMITASLSERVIDLLLDKEVFDHLKAKEDFNETLAWLCMDHSWVYMYGSDNGEYSEKYRQLLSNWTGVSIEQKTLPSLAFTLDLLYGPHLRDIYDLHVDEDTDTGSIQEKLRLVRSLGLPFVFKNQDSSVEVTIPEALL